MPRFEFACFSPVVASSRVFVSIWSYLAAISCSLAAFRSSYAFRYSSSSLAKARRLLEQLPLPPEPPFSFATGAMPVQLPLKIADLGPQELDVGHELVHLFGVLGRRHREVGAEELLVLHPRLPDHFGPGGLLVGLQLAGLSLEEDRPSGAQSRYHSGTRIRY